MTSFAYESDAERVRYDDVEKDVIVSYVDDRFELGKEALAMLPGGLPGGVSRLILEFILHPLLVELVPGEYLAFWDSEMLDRMGLVALDVSLEPPLEAFDRFGLKAFYKGSFDNNFYSMAGGIYAVAERNLSFVPAWRESVAGSTYVCATNSELVPDLQFVF